jgi:hypothetical protein
MRRRYGDFAGTRLKLCGRAAKSQVVKIIPIEVARFPPGLGASASRAAKVLNFAEDAHPKNMSTFVADEHLRGRSGSYWYAESAAKVRD